MAYTGTLSTLHGILTAVVLATANACASPSTKAVVPAGHGGRLGSQVQTLGADHFTLDLPASWRRAEVDILGLAAERSIFTLLGMKEKDLEKHRRQERLTLKLMAQAPDAAGSVRVYWLSYFKDWAEVTERDPNVKARRRVRLPAGEALELRTELTVPTFPRLATLDYYLQSPAGASYGIRFFSAAERFDELLPLFQAIAESLRWKPIGPIQFAGFSFAPPSPRAWVAADRSDRGMTFIRSSPSPTHTVNAGAWRVEFPEAEWRQVPSFQDLVRSIIALRYGYARYATPRISLSKDARPGCVRHSVQVEDRGVPGHQGEVFTQTEEGLYCQHPKRARLIVVLYYSQRFRRADERSLDIAAEVAEFLASLQFASLD